ncbi:MAG: TolC family protein [Oligoflexia bacterium]|nr:TolC family protein [Oligoflexia bacterium]
MNIRLLFFPIVLLLFGSTFIFSFSSSWAETSSLTLSAFERTPLYTCNNKTCLTLEEAVERAKKNSFESREKVEQLYRARLMIKVRLGAIIPHFNLNTLAGGVALGLGDIREGVTGVISSLLGFLFPDRWFKWKESKLFFLAEKYSFLTILSNQVNQVENLYFMVHQEILNYQIYQEYLRKIDQIIIMLQEREQNGEANPQDLASLNVLRSELMADSILIRNTLREILPSLAHAIAFESSANWQDFSIASLQLPNLITEESLTAEPFYQTILERSYEIKSLGYLKQAARYSRKARAFSFLSPEAGPENSFGFGYLSNMRIGRSEETSVKIKIEQETSLLKKSLYDSVNDYNTAIELFKESLNGQQAAQVLIDGLFDDLRASGKLDSERLAQNLAKGIIFDVYRNYSMHFYLMAKSNLNRLLRKGKFYENMEQLTPANTQRIHRFHDRTLYKENMEITKDIERGIIKI